MEAARQRLCRGAPRLHDRRERHHGLLRQVELRSQLFRLLSILKVRSSDYDSAIREFQISRRGIEVAATFESADDILTGVARTTASSDDA